MPETMSAGRASRITWWMPSQEQSVGVPSTAYQRGLTSRSRSGRWIEIACDVALCSASGATTQTSPSGSIADARAFSPSDWKPSSFETRMPRSLAHRARHTNPTAFP